MFLFKLYSSMCFIIFLILLFDVFIDKSRGVKYTVKEFLLIVVLMIAIAITPFINIYGCACVISQQFRERSLHMGKRKFGQ